MKSENNAPTSNTSSELKGMLSNGVCSSGLVEMLGMFHLTLQHLKLEFHLELF